VGCGADLHSVDGIVDTVHTEIVVWCDARARRRRERRHSQQLCGPATICTRLTNQRIARRDVTHHVTSGRVHLHVDGGVECFLADCRHQLDTKYVETMKS